MGTGSPHAMRRHGLNADVSVPPFKIFFREDCPAAFQPVNVHHPALNSAVLGYLIYPLAELNRPRRVDLKAHRDYGLQAVVFGVIRFPVSGSYEKFSNN
jgi:hypothetical protein